MYTVKSGNIDIIHTLLQSKEINPNKKQVTFEGKMPDTFNTPLLLAVPREDTAIVQALISKGAEADLKSSDLLQAITPIELA